jgi:hypothetical protein
MTQASAAVKKRGIGSLRELRQILLLHEIVFGLQVAELEAVHPLPEEQVSPVGDQHIVAEVLHGVVGGIVALIDHVADLRGRHVRDARMRSGIDAPPLREEFEVVGRGVLAEPDQRDHRLLAEAQALDLLSRLALDLGDPLQVTVHVLDAEDEDAIRVPWMQARPDHLPHFRERERVAVVDRFVDRADEDEHILRRVERLLHHMVMAFMEWPEPAREDTDVDLSHFTSLIRSGRQPASGLDDVSRTGLCRTR